MLSHSISSEILFNLKALMFSNKIVICAIKNVGSTMSTKDIPLFLKFSSNARETAAVTLSARRA